MKKEKNRVRIGGGKAVAKKGKAAGNFANVEDPLKYAVSVIGGKWKVRILWAARDGNPLRYREIKQLVPEVTDMMLSQSLRELTECGLLERRQFREIPPKVEYKITGRGEKLIPAIKLLSEWAENELAI